MFIVILLTLLFAFIKSLHFIYLFQIKEYRFDRFYVYVKEQGLTNLLFNFHSRYPARTMRNGIILFFVLIVLGLCLLYALEQRYAYYFFTFFLPFSPILGFIIVSIGVLLTNIPSTMLRQLSILKAQTKLQRTKTKFIGITGSFGKSSVKEYVANLLSEQFKIAKTLENMNTDVGVAISINKNLKKNTQYFVAEFGSYKIGETKRASYYIPIQYAILTGLGNQHLDLYGSRENLIEEETYLLTQVPEDGTAYIPYHTPNKTTLRKKLKSKIVTYGLQENSDIRAKKLDSDYKVQKAKIWYNNHSFKIETKLIGAHTIENLLPAIALSLDLGIDEKTVQDSISKLEPIQGKLSLHKGKKNAKVIHDAANSNVDGFVAAIQTLNSLPHKSKIIISQGIIELGVEKRSSYERIIHELHQSDCVLFTTDPLFKQISDSDKIITFNDVKKAKEHALSIMNKHTAIVLEGKFPHWFIEGMMK